MTRIFIALRPALYQELFTVEADQKLRQWGEVTCQVEETNLTSAMLAERLPGYDIVITGWGTPQFDAEVLNKVNRLRLIAHSAGTIKRMLPPAVFRQGINVTHASSAIAPAVAEMTLLLILLCLRQVHRLDRQLKTSGAWDAAKTIGLGQELAGQRVGVIGAGYTGRCVIPLLRAFQAEVWVYDPYLDLERARLLGVHKVDLVELLSQCPIVTVQAPPTQETYRMIGVKEFALLQDGAIFINTARAHLVDQDALLAELRSGRIQAALDVFDEEPLPPNHPFLTLENVIVTPHVAGASRQARLRQGDTVVAEIQRFLAGEPLLHPVTEQMLEIMA
jgi:phosphoglycerate dehydrogenase-like enzyme